MGPKSVAIVAMGLSNIDYTLAVATHGSRKRFDEVWGINVMGDIIHCDRVFMMDHLSFFKNDPRTDKHLYENYREFLSRCKVPVYTAEADPEFPCMVEYPLEDVINDLKSAYFNNSVAYAVAMAIHLNVEELFIFGADYNYNDGNKSFELGRGCVEFLLGIAIARGIIVSVAQNSSLLDTNIPHDKRFYGYPYEIEALPDDDNPGKVKVVRHKDKPWYEWK